MEFLLKVINKILVFEQNPQQVGLSHFKHTHEEDLTPKKQSLNNKDVKLSDLMRRAG